MISFSDRRRLGALRLATGRSMTATFASHSVRFISARKRVSQCSVWQILTNNGIGASLTRVFRLSDKRTGSGWWLFCRFERVVRASLEAHATGPITDCTRNLGLADERGVRDGAEKDRS